MTPFPPKRAGFHAGGLGRYSLYGVNGFVLGVVETVGYRPTDPSDGGKQTPSRGHHPKHQNPSRVELYKPTAMKPTQWGNPTLKGEA